MGDTPEPGAALLDRPAAVVNGHDRGAPVGCVAPGYDQTAAQSAQGITGAGQARRSWAQIVSLVPGLAAPARCPACGADVAWPEGQATGTGRGGPPTTWPQ